MGKPKIGVIGIVSEDLKSDFWATLKRLSGLGYQGIEVASSECERLGVSPKEFSVRCEGAGLDLVAVHCTKYVYAEKGYELVSQAAEMGAAHLCIAWGPAESTDEISRDADLYNELGTSCRDAGLVLTYHNHDHEFALIPGLQERYIDALLRQTDKGLVKLHFDIAWAVFGGVDPVTFAASHEERLAVLHVKDLAELAAVGARDRAKARFAEVGDGIVPCAQIVRFANAKGLPWLVVEQDQPGELPPWQSVTRSFKNVQAMLERTSDTTLRG